jgi:hypothetical protein
MNKVVWTLTLESTPVGKTLPICRMTVKANTKEEALKGMQMILTGVIDTSKIPKTGLDLTGSNEKT